MQKVGTRKDSYNTDTVLVTSPFEPEGLPKVGWVGGWVGGCVRACVSVSVWLCPCSNRSSDNHHFTSTATIIRFDVVLRPQRPFGLFGMGSPGRPPLLSPTQFLPSATIMHQATAALYNIKTWSILNARTFMNYDQLFLHDTLMTLFF